MVTHCWKIVVLLVLYSNIIARAQPSHPIRHNISLDGFPSLWMPAMIHCRHSVCYDISDIAAIDLQFQYHFFVSAFALELL